jgi:hypothetical protein
MASPLWNRLARAAVSLYPRGWRARYEEELMALLESSPTDVRVVINLVGGALRERGVHRAAALTARLIGRIAWSWVAAVSIVAALWVVFVLAFAPYGAEMFGFDRYDWTARRLRDTRYVVMPLASFHFLPSLLCSLPAVGLLMLLRAGRKPWLARIAATSSFLLFGLWWDGVLLFDKVYGPVFGQVSALIGGWLISAWLFPRSPKTMSGPSSVAAQAAQSDKGESTPRGMLRLGLNPVR